MARPSNGSFFNIPQLERILQERRTDLGRLERQRSELQRKLDGLDRQIVKLQGSLRGGVGRRGVTAGGRARNSQSLVEVLESVLKGGKPMKVGDIVDAVQSSGYRSNSANFRGIVNQTLIKERKRFAPTDRGVYQLKGAGESKGSKKEKSAA
jgi:septal ring factor EnvC (AmiA/AmiB activator)